MFSVSGVLHRKEISSKITQGLTTEEARQTSHSWKKDSYLALGGVAHSPLINYVTHMQTQGKTIDTIWLCLDNDIPDKNGNVPGIKAGIKMMDKLREAGFEGHISCHLPIGKDWNDDLLSASRDSRWKSSDSIIWDEAFVNEHISPKTYHRREDLEVALVGLVHEHTQAHKRDIHHRRDILNVCTEEELAHIAR